MKNFLILGILLITGFLLAHDNQNPPQQRSTKKRTTPQHKHPKNQNAHYPTHQKKRPSYKSSIIRKAR